MIEIEFEDYCVAYEIFEPVFASRLYRLPARLLAIGKTVKKLSHRLKRGVTVREVANELNWGERTVYKYVEDVVKAGLIKYEPGTNEQNLKRLLPRHRVASFLPQPRQVLKRNPEIGRKVKYVDPFTGEWKRLKR